VVESSDIQSNTIQGLPRRYDPQVIARYYRWRFWKTLARSLNILFSVGRYCLGLKLDQWMGIADRNVSLRAMQLRTLLTNLGPTFIKIGQALSTRPDLVRQDYLEELTLLQDKLPQFPNEIAFSTIETELEQPLDDIFREISSKPVAAASLGQVYQGRLYDGKVVAIKVQRPQLRPKLALDLYLIRNAAHWLGQFFPIEIGQDLAIVVDEFGTKLFEEIDYQNEGRNAEQFARNFADDPAVKVPDIYWRYCGQRVLTMEWIDGYKLTSTECAVHTKTSPDHLIRIGVESGLRQLLEFGFFHADPHPGNLIAMPDGRVAYIDFGMMDQLNQEMKETLVDALVHLVNKNYAQLAHDFVRLGFLAPGTDITPIIPALETVFADVMGASVRDFNFKTVSDRFSELMYRYPFRIPAKFALIIRSVITQEGVALCLNPDFKLVEISFPYIAKRLLSEESPAFRRRLLEVLFKDGKFQWERLENLIAIARSDQRFDLMPTARMGMQYLLSEEGRFLQQQLLLAFTENEQLHTKELGRLWELVKDDLQPNRLLGAAVAAFAEFSGEAISHWPPFAVFNTNGKTATASHSNQELERKVLQ
jgi:predicted unusual protein kinase regulating ubiquinone biosynthesis (AarF/ABC1/UbiB family)